MTEFAARLLQVVELSYRGASFTAVTRGSNPVEAVAELDIRRIPPRSFSFQSYEARKASKVAT